MREIKVSVKAKVGTIQMSKEFDYQEPETWQEAIEMATKAGGDEAGEFKRYLNERKTNFQDSKRKKMVDSLTKRIAEKMAEMGITL